MKYEDASDNNFPNDYDKSKVDSRIKLRTDKVDRSMWGDNVREAISQGVQIADVTANEAKDISNKANKTSADVQKQFNTQIKGQNKDNESKDARISQADGKTYDTLKQRLDAMDKKPQQTVDDLQIGGRNYFAVVNWNDTTQKYQDSFNGGVYDLPILGLEPSTQYTISTNLNASDNGYASHVFAMLSKDEAPSSGDNGLSKGNPRTVTVGKNGVLIIGIRTSVGTPSDGSAKVQVEKGTKATDWTPAPEDSHHHQAFRRGTRFFAHRGAQSIAPENSRPAIQKAGNHAGVEIDIHTTADGVWMVMHDGTVDRMTNGTGAISSFTYKEIRKLKIDSGHNLNKYSGNDLIIPTLEEALADCKDHQLIPVIEIKVDDTDNYSSDNYDSLVTLINKFDLKDSCMFISFNYQALAEIKKRLPLVEVSWLQSVISKNTIARAQALGVNAGLDSSYTNKSVTLDNIKKVHDAGLKMGVWTLKDDSQRTKLIGMGVDFITTNSLSGERRYADLNTKNGWANYGGGYHRSYVQEVAPGQVTIYFNILGDKAKDAKGTVFANIPSWAVPTFNLWNECIIRNSSSVEVSTFDVVGNELRVGFNWNHRRTVGWVSGNVTYHV